VFNITDQEKKISEELDWAILMAVLKSQHLSPSEHLRFALMWNRVDIATSYIHLYGQKLSPGMCFMYDVSLIALSMFLSN
jgi:hypothetical protein